MFIGLSEYRSFIVRLSDITIGLSSRGSDLQRQARRNRRRWRLKPAVASDRFSRASSDSDAMRFARLQPFFPDCVYTPFFFQRARILSDSRSSLDNYL